MRVSLTKDVATMKLKTFRIKNIKSIIDSGVCHLASDNITIFAGQNESGKSAVYLLQIIEVLSSEQLSEITTSILEEF